MDEKNQQLLYRIDERVSFLANDFALFKADIHRLIIDMEKRFVSKDEFQPLKDGFVSRDEFQPVKLLVYGLVGLIMVAVIGGILALVVGR